MIFELERTAEQFQVDLPPPRPVVTRFNIDIGRCVGCGKRVQGRILEQTSDALGAASSQVGPGAKSWAAWLHTGSAQLRETFGLVGPPGVNVTAGAISQAAQSTSTALVLSSARSLSGERLNDDRARRVGWRVGGAGAWLWAMATTGAACYWVADGRGFEEACQVISPEFSGVMVRDGWAPYRRFEKATHQSCSRPPAPALRRSSSATCRPGRGARRDEYESCSQTRSMPASSTTSNERW